MYFRKNVSEEKREYFLKLLKQYKKEMQMTPEERNFINAERMMKEQIEWFDSLSYEEQQELLHTEGEDRDVGEVGENTLASDDRELPF